jgi:hypothetical protein
MRAHLGGEKGGLQRGLAGRGKCNGLNPQAESAMRYGSLTLRPEAGSDSQVVHPEEREVPMMNTEAPPGC